MADLITRLKVESNEYDSKIKRAAQSIQSMEQACRKVGGTFQVVEKEQLEFVRGLGQMETVSKNARGRIGELSAAFVDLRAQYNRLSQEEKNSPFGKALNESLNQLKTRVKDAKAELATINQELTGSKFGQFGGVIDTIGHKLGLTTNATELLTSKTALMYAGIGAGIAIVTKATEAWVGYNNELAKQDQITTVTTGLKGDDADRMTDKMRALSDTYKVDFREAINAANTLMTQFGKTGDEATQLIKDGMQGMIQGDGPKLLSMIQQYAPAFRDAGVSASQLVAVIQNSEGGIFTDQNMNAIVMGMKNIRLMTKQTSEALQKLGIDGQEMTRKLNDGSLTIFDALKQVASQLKNVDSNSQAAGEVMQAVFGRQGVTAGTNIAKAIETLNTNLEETKKQTGEVGDAFAELQTANEKLNAAIREAFSYDGWEQMAAGIKADLITALADVLEYLGKIKNFWAGNLPKGTPVLPDWSENSLEYVKGGGTKEEREKRYNFELKRLQKSYADAGKPYSYEDKNGGLTEVLRTPREVNEIRIGAIRAIRTLQSQKDYLISGEKPKTNTGNGNGSGNGSTTTPKTTTAKTTPADEVAKAEKEYADTISNAQQKLMEGVMKSEEYDKAVFDGQQKLGEAYLKAYNATGDEKYLNAFGQTADHIKEMQGVVDANIEAQKAAEQSARQLEQAQKRLADAQNELADAQASGDLKKIYAAEKKVEQAQVQVNARTGNGATGAVEVPITAGNLEAFTGHIKEEMAKTNFADPIMKSLEENMSDATAIATIMQTAIQNGIDTSQFDTSGIMKKLLNNEDIDDDVIQEYVEQLNEQLKAKFDETEWPDVLIKFNAETKQIENAAKAQLDDAQKTQKAWGLAAQSVNNLGNALNAIEDPGAKAAGTVIKAIADIALGFAQASKAADTTASGWAWLAWLAAGTAAMATTISTVHSLTGFSNGGIVGGNSFSGDNIYAGSGAMVNSGELILSHSQQSTLAQELERGNGEGMNLNPYVTGEYIFLGVNNYLKGAGYGSLVTTKG